MSAADSRSGRIRRREDDEYAQQTAEANQSASLPDNESADAVTAAHPSPADPSALAQSDGVQPLPEQIRKRPRRSPRFSSPLDMLAVIELQLVLQFMDTKSKLMAARCSRRLLQTVSTPFAWRAAPPFVVEARSPADVHRIGTSLLRLAPIRLRCDEMKSLQCVATVPHLVALEQLDSDSFVPVAAADLTQLLQHPNLTRLESMRLDAGTSKLLTVDTVRLITRLPQLRAFAMTVPPSAPRAALLQPLTDAPALTDLAISHLVWTPVSAALLRAIGGCLGLRRLRLRDLHFSTGHLSAFCSSPNMRRLQHLELIRSLAVDGWINGIGADEYRTAFSALEQLQSLSLTMVNGIDALLPHLHCAPELRLISIRCEPDSPDIGTHFSPLPSRDVLSALLTAAPQLEVRLLMPATLDRWLALRPWGTESDRATYEEQWQDLQQMGAELERITVVEEQKHSA